MRNLVRWLVVFVILAGCSMSRSTDLRRAFPEHPSPQEFQSPLEALRLFYQTIEEEGLLSKQRRGQLSSEDKKFLAAASILARHQQQLERELQLSQAVNILPGHSYAFELQSFCVHPGMNRPILGDGFRVGPLMENASDWLPKILEHYQKESIPQERVQVLIWSLISGSRFDELSRPQQHDLLKIDSKAPLHFGNRKLENFTEDLISRWIPSDIRELQSRVEDFRQVLNDTQLNYEEIASILAPISKRMKPVHIGWVKTPEGFLTRIQSLGSYSSASVEIYMPLGPDPSFRPSQFLGMPDEGQRLALSANVISSMQRTYRGITDELIDFKTGRELSKEEQDLIRKHPLDAYRVYKNSRIAMESTKHHFPRQIPRNNRADAYRHFVWAALNARDLGTERAREFLNAHEEAFNQSRDEKEMDLWNNERGILAVQKLGSESTLEQIEREALEGLGQQWRKVSP